MSPKISNDDRRLGMDRAISRRDFVNGVGVALTGAMFGGGVAGPAFGDAPAAHGSAGTAAAPALGDTANLAGPGLDPYPPRRTGMRGSHPGAFEVAHQVRDTHQWDLSAAVDTGESYDLVVEIGRAHV